LVAPPGRKPKKSLGDPSQSAQLKLSYKGCVRPTSADLLVAYLDQGNRVLELPPSLDLRADDEVEADIDHFSRYAIAY